MSFERVEIGDCTLYRGDCLEVLPTLAPPPDVVITDPPYEITASGGGIVRCRQYLHDIEGFTDGGFDSAILDKFDNWMVFSTLRQVPELVRQAMKSGNRWMLITWNKPNPTPLCNGNYLPDTEYVLHSWSAGKLFGNCAEKHRFIVHPSTQGDKLHPNEKPLYVMSKLIRNGSGFGGTVLDPYMGSGTTGVACVQMGRKFIGIERERKYFDIACKRIEDANGIGSLFCPKHADASLFDSEELA